MAVLRSGGLRGLEPRCANWDRMGPRRAERGGQDACEVPMLVNDLPWVVLPQVAPSQARRPLVRACVRQIGLMWHDGQSLEDVYGPNAANISQTSSRMQIIPSLQQTWLRGTWPLGRLFSSTNRWFSTSMIVSGRVANDQTKSSMFASLHSPS